MALRVQAMDAGWAVVDDEGAIYGFSETNAAAWRMLDLMDGQARKDEETRTRINVAFHDR